MWSAVPIHILPLGKVQKHPKSTGELAASTENPMLGQHSQSWRLERGCWAKGWERKDTCRNTANLPEGGFQWMRHSWKKINKVNNCARRSHDRRLSSSLGWRTRLSTVDLVPKGHRSCACCFKRLVFCDIFLKPVNFCLKLCSEDRVPDARDYAPHQTHQICSNTAFCLQLPPFME